MSSSPQVSVIIPAFNLAHYLQASIDSVIAQTMPAAEVEIIVVDDGSTDDTPALLAGYGERILTVRQPNGGLVKAVDAGLALASGTYVALHDADDEMPPDRLRSQADELARRPQAGLVYGDMEMIAADGSLIAPSFFAYTGGEPRSGRVLGKLLARNFVSGGCSMFRRALMPAFHPINPHAAYPDFWLAATIACVAEVHFCGGIANRYRQHDANMGLAADAARTRSIWKTRELPWRLWMLRNLVGDRTVGAGDLQAAYSEFHSGLLTSAMGEPGGARALIHTSPDAAREILELLPPPGIGLPRSRALLRGIGYDPFDGAAAVDLAVALLTESAFGPYDAPPPLMDLRRRATTHLTQLDTLLANPRALIDFAASAAANPTQTLVVLATPGADSRPLQALFAGEPALAHESCDVVLVDHPATPPARALLASWASGWLGQDAPADFRADTGFGEL